MTTAPAFVEEFLDFKITDPGTVRARPRRLVTPAPVCRTCQPSKVTEARRSGADVYSSCFVCAS